MVLFHIANLPPCLYWKKFKSVRVDCRVCSTLIFPYVTDTKASRPRALPSRAVCPRLLQGVWQEATHGAFRVDSCNNRVEELSFQEEEEPSPPLEQIASRERSCVFFTFRQFFGSFRSHKWSANEFCSCGREREC